MARPKHSIRYDDDLWPLLEALAESTGRPITTIVNDALRAYLIPAEDGMEARMSSIESRVAVLEQELSRIAREERS